MPKRHLELRHTDLDNGCSCPPFEREYWQALEILTYEYGWSNWRELFHIRVFPEKPKGIPLANFVRQAISKYPFEVSETRRSAP